VEYTGPFSGLGCLLVLLQIGEKHYHIVFTFTFLFADAKTFLRICDFHQGVFLSKVFSFLE